VKGMIKFGRKSALTIPRRANPKLCWRHSMKSPNYITATHNFYDDAIRRIIQDTTHNILSRMLKLKAVQTVCSAYDLMSQQTLKNLVQVSRLRQPRPHVRRILSLLSRHACDFFWRLWIRSFNITDFYVPHRAS
jgi:hypothetical protein